MSKLDRETVYNIVDSERTYQDRTAGNARRTGDFQDKKLTPGELLLCMEKCLHDAREAWYKPGGQDFASDFVRKVTALGVQYMENYGANPRVG